MIKFVFAIFAICFFQNAYASLTCTSIFLSETPPQSLSVVHHFTMTTDEWVIPSSNGIKPFTKGTIRISDYGRLVAAIEYSVKDNVAEVNRVTDMENVKGLDIYRSMISRIVLLNPNVDTILTSLTGYYYKYYLWDLEAMSETAALENNPVYKQLARAGFTQIGYQVDIYNTTSTGGRPGYTGIEFNPETNTIAANNYPAFLRFTVKRGAAAH